MMARETIRILFTLATIINIPPSNPQSLQINDITNNAGALFLQKGEGKIIDGYDRLLHVIDFSQFENSLTVIENVAREIGNTPSNFSEILKLKIKEIKFILDTLYKKSNRSKRAIDILGHTIKFITGNLDSEDLQIINSNLDELRKTGNTYVKQNNRQIRINSKFENRLNLINNQIKDQSNILSKFTKQSNLLVSENDKILLILQLDTFLENLKSIEYAVVLARMNIVNTLILTPKEIETIMQELAEQGLNSNYLDDASSYLTTTVLHRRSSIIICVNIPRLLQTTYARVYIEPLPQFNRTVKLQYQDVFINSEQILAIASPCRETKKVKICERKQLIEISDSLCEAPLLRREQGQCTMLEKSPTTETRMIASGTLLVIAVHQDVVINSTCGIQSQNLTGIHLVTFQNCSVYVGNELFENYELWFDHQTIIPLQLAKIKTLHTERHVNISQLQELHVRNRIHLETVDLHYKVGFASFGTVSMLAFLTCVIIKYRLIAKARNCSGRAILKGGRVKIESNPKCSTSTKPAPAQRTITCTRTARSAVLELGSAAHTATSIVGTNVDNTSRNVSTLDARSSVLGNSTGWPYLPKK